MIIGTDFVDLSFGYNTVNHDPKTLQHNQGQHALWSNPELLSHRRLYVELNNERSRWKI